MSGTICGDRYRNPMNGNEFICLEPRGHAEGPLSTMHEADTMKGPVNW